MEQAKGRQIAVEPSEKSMAPDESAFSGAGYGEADGGLVNTDSIPGVLAPHGVVFPDGPGKSPLVAHIPSTSEVAAGDSSGSTQNGQTKGNATDAGRFIGESAVGASTVTDQPRITKRAYQQLFNRYIDARAGGDEDLARETLAQMRESGRHIRSKKKVTGPLNKGEIDVTMFHDFAEEAGVPVIELENMLHAAVPGEAGPNTHDVAMDALREWFGDRADEVLRRYILHPATDALLHTKKNYLDVLHWLQDHQGEEGTDHIYARFLAMGAEAGAHPEYFLSLVGASVPGHASTAEGHERNFSELATILGSRRRAAEVLREWIIVHNKLDPQNPDAPRARAWINEWFGSEDQAESKDAPRVTVY